MIEEVVERLARQVDEKKYGKYRGFVKDRSDPEKRGRLRLTVPSLFGSAITDWALPCFAAGGAAGHGTFVVPEVDSQVWVEFEGGNVAAPIWTGCFFQHERDVPEAARRATPSCMLFRTAGGHELRFEDAEGEESIVLRHAGGAEFAVDAKGSVVLKNKHGAQLALDAEEGVLRLEDALGNALVMNDTGIEAVDIHQNKLIFGSSGVTIKAPNVVLDATSVRLGSGVGQPLVLGQSLLGYLGSLIHTSSPSGGPTSPPVVPPTGSLLALKVTAS